MQLKFAAESGERAEQAGSWCPFERSGAASLSLKLFEFLLKEKRKSYWNLF